MILAAACAINRTGAGNVKKLLELLPTWLTESLGSTNSSSGCIWRLAMALLPYWLSAKIQNPKYPGELTLLKENTGSLTLVRTATDPTTEKVLGFGLAGGSRPDSESSSISGPSGAAEAAAFCVAGCNSPKMSVLSCLTPDLAMAVGVGSFSIGVGITRKIQIK